MPRAQQNRKSKPEPNPGILGIAPYSAGKPAGKPDRKVIKLSSNETPLGPSLLAIKAFIDESSALHRYPDGGCEALRQAISDVHGIPTERIVCGAGSDELIGLLVHAYAAVGDNIVMSRHGFLMYKIYAQSFGVETIMAPEKNLRTDVDAVLSCITPRTKLVFVANPNNPTGSYITRQEMKRLHTGLPPHVLLAVDGAYSEYVSAQDYSDGCELVDKHDNVVMLRTFSKVYGLAALRLGWAYAPEHVVEVLNRVRGPFNVSGPAQAAGIAAVRDEKYTRAACEHNEHWRGWLKKEITGLGLKVAPSVANFLLIEFPTGKKNTAAAAEFLSRRGLMLRNVASYGLPKHLRMTVGLEQDNKTAIAHLKDFLK